MNAATNKQQRRRSRRSSPSSLPDHFSRKGYLSVSDLVGPSWCEYNYQYGILSLSHLPPSQRPATITTEAGQTLTASPQIVEQKEVTLNAGKAVHSVLEREVAPVQVHVETTTKEDSWALRLMNLWCDVQGLLQLDPGVKGKSGRKGKTDSKANANADACVREVPVYGWIHGVLVMGVIDEIEKRAIELHPQAKQQQKSAKTWASQEEWKKDQLRSKTSPKKPKPDSPGPSKPNTRTLTSFFGSQSESQSKEPSQQSHESLQPESKPGWGYFLSDTKTRISSWLPAEQDQHSARMQCMTYKRLFDGLLLGALSARPTSDTSSHHTHHMASFDPNATSMDWVQTFAALQLDPHQPLSTAFLRDAEPLCDSWGTDLAVHVAENDADVCTLHHVQLLLEKALRDLVHDARKGQGFAKHEDGHIPSAGVIQDELALTYRWQTRLRSEKRKRAPRAVKSSESKDVRSIGLRQSTLDDAAQTTVGSRLPIGQDPDVTDAQQHPEFGVLQVGASVELEAAAATGEGDRGMLEQRKSIDAFEGQQEASCAIQQALSSPPPCTPRKPSLSSPSSSSSPIKTTPTRSSSPPPSPTSPTSPSPSLTLASQIIGVVRFTHDASALDTFLRWTISMWKGERELVGVRPDETRRCWTCEWMQGCEWRSLQSDRHTVGVRKAAKAHGGVEVKQVQLASDQTKEGEGEGEGEGGDEFWSNINLDAIEVRDSTGKLLDW